MRDIKSIEAEMPKATKKRRMFLRECISILLQFTEKRLKDDLDVAKRNVRIYLKRRKESGDKKLYAEELKTYRKYIKGLKYLLK